MKKNSVVIPVEFFKKLDSLENKIDNVQFEILNNPNINGNTVIKKPKKIKR